MTKIYWNCRIRFLHLHQPETGIAHDSHASCQTKTKKKIVEASINKSSRLGHKNKNFTRDYPLAIHVLFGFNQGFNIRQNLFFNSSKEMISYRHQKKHTFGFLCLNLVPVVGVILDFPSTRKTDIQASFQLNLLSNGLVDPDKNKCKIFPPPNPMINLSSVLSTHTA